MAVKLSTTRKIRTAQVDLGEGQIITFRYRAFTPYEWEESDREAKVEDEFTNVVRLSKVLVDTGLEDDDGNPIPPTIEGLGRVELPILAAMLDAILSTTLPKKAS